MLTEALDLTRKYLFEAVVVGNGSERGSVGGQRDRRISGTVVLVAADDLRGDVLGVGGTTAIADQQQLVAGQQRADDRMRDRVRSRQQRCIARCAIQRGERSFKVDCDRILAQGAPLWLQTVAVVTMAPLVRKAGGIMSRRTHHMKSRASVAATSL